MTTFVYHSGALGDFITTIPLLARWKRFNPDSYTILAGRPIHASLLRGSGILNEVIDVDSAGFAAFLSGNDSTSPILPGIPRKPDTAIIFASEDSPVTCKMSRTGAIRILRQIPFPDISMHIVDYRLSLTGDITRLSAEERAPVIIPEHEYVKQAEALLPDIGNTIVIHPGSGSRIKNWPQEKFVRLSKRLENSGFQIAWITGPADSGITIPANSRSLDSPPLSLLAAILSSAALFVGNDSGVSHLAAAAGCRCAVIFGPSNPDIWKPRGKKVAIVKTSTECGPCHLRKPYTSVCGRKCMENIEPAAVFDACMRLL